MLRLTIGMRALPLTIVIAYLLFTISLFYFGPLPWPVSNPGALGSFLTAVIVGIASFGLLGSTGPAAGSATGSWKIIIVAGAILSFVLLFPSAYFYADKMPWQLFEAMRDQGATYEALKAKLATPAGDRTLISLIRAATYPVIFAVVPLAIVNWRRMTWPLWTLVAVTAFSSIAFSILRGTDREVFDIIIVGTAAFLVVIARQSIALRRLAIPAVCAVIVVTVALGAFADRRLQRAAVQHIGTQASNLSEHSKTPAGWLDVMCIRTICLDPDHVLVRHVDAPKKYAVLMLTSYMTQGYYGLSLAMTEDFHSTFGIGHSPAIARLYERVSGSNYLYKRSYSYGLRKLGWSDESQWSSIFTSLANDVDFHGAIAVICLLAFLLGRSWRDAVGSSNDAAAIVFCLLFQLFIYAPANNQLAQTMDGYFAAVAWLCFWFFEKRTPLLRLSTSR